MNYREMNLAVFEGKPIPHVLFQPRMEPWYAWHKTFNKMPARYQGMSLLDLFDDLAISMRYVHYYTGQPDPICRTFSANVQISDTTDGDHKTVVIQTPYGELVVHHEMTPDKVWRQVSFPVKDRESLIKLRWLFEEATHSFVIERFRQGSAFVGDRGYPQFWVPKSPYQALAQQWMTMQDLVYALVDCREEVELAMAAIDASYDKLYEQLVEHSDEVRIVNFGENVHEQLMNPRYLNAYFLPWYHKRCGQLRAAGIFTHNHIDGYFNGLLPRLKDFPFDGIEALTPVPQGDMTLERIAEHIGDKVLMDGIPAVYFMDTYPRELLMQCVERIVELFHPRLVLGISDELPEGTDEEAVERVRMVSEYCRSATGA